MYGIKTENKSKHMKNICTYVGKEKIYLKYTNDEEKKYINNKYSETFVKQKLQAKH